MSLDRRCVLMPTLSSADLALPAGAWRAALLSSTARRIFAVLTATALSIGLAHAQDRRKDQDAAPPGDAALLKKLEQMEQSLRVLESQLKQRDARAIEAAHGKASPSTNPPANAPTGRPLIPHIRQRMRSRPRSATTPRNPPSQSNPRNKRAWSAQ